MIAPALWVCDYRHKQHTVNPWIYPWIQAGP